jgi:ubiquinone/menaquinone biosynthesis C-methylase UbiE
VSVLSPNPVILSAAKGSLFDLRFSIFDFLRSSPRSALCVLCVSALSPGFLFPNSNFYFLFSNFVFSPINAQCFSMPAPVDLYDNAYAHYDSDVYRQIRVATYGRDLGQTGWATTQESDEIPRSLQLTSNSNVLEIGCGSGRYALQIASTIRCHILGLDLNVPGIHNATRLASVQNLSSRARFLVADCAQPLPFADSSFDAAFSNDVLCHIRDRLALLRELARVLKPAARFLFSDALIIGGMISHHELANRSSIGYYLFSPPGENERLLTQAGFRVLQVLDTTANAASIAQRWHDARQAHSECLEPIEGPQNFRGLQQFLSTVHTLTAERRLLRLLYVAELPN